jgi:hypothetical protein
MAAPSRCLAIRMYRGAAIGELIVRRNFEDELISLYGPIEAENGRQYERF